MMPLGRGLYGPQGHGRQDLKRTLIHCYIQTIYESSRPCSFQEEDILYFSHCKSMGVNDPRGGAMIGRIYEENHYTLLHTNYESSWLCGYQAEDFFFVFPMTSPGRSLYGPQGHGWQDL